MSAEHKSDCAVHNEPAFPAGPCDCGAARCKCGHPLSEHSEYDDVPCEGTNFRPPGTFVACECPGFEAAEVPTAAPVLPRGVQIRLSEPVSETFDCIRGDIHLYETDQIDYATMMRGLRESVAVLEAKAVKS